MQKLSFGLLNYSILVVYMASMTAIGVSLTRRQKTSKDYFLAGRKMPWLIVGMSMFASMTSAISYMGMPGTVARENLSILAGYFLSPFTAPFIILMFYPLYRKLEVTTSYEYIFRRYGSSARYGVSGLFLLARIGWLGAVIYAPALALSVVTGMDLLTTILLIGLVATVYTSAGGLQAVVLTDAVQFVILVGGAVIVAVSLTMKVDGGAGGIFQVAAANGHLFNWHFSFFQACVPAFCLSYFFSFMQDYGCDQVGVQRLLSSKSFGGIARSIFFNSSIDVLMFSLLAFVGLGLFAYYRQFPTGEIPGDKLLPYYIMTVLPNGISGLAISGIFAAAISSVDSGIHSMSTVLVNDFVRPLRKKTMTDLGSVRLGRAFTLMIGVFGTGIAFYVSRIEHILKASSMVLGLFNGPILALFVLGVLTRRVHFRGWLAGAIAGIAITLVIMNIEIGGQKLHWAFYMPCSLLVSITVSYLASLVIPGERAETTLTVWQLLETRGKDLK